MISHAQKVLELIDAKGLLRPLDLNEIKVPRIVLTRMVNNGQITKIARGLYCAPDKPTSEHASLSEVARKHP
jgi:predicted transcriptional regulator of viral defense system